MKRRDFLKTSLVFTSGMFLGLHCTDDAEDTSYKPGQAYFPQSIASGDPKTNSVILWARVYDESKTGQDLSVDLQLSLDDAFTSLVEINGATTHTEVAKAGFDNCVKIRVTGLEPATYYYYRFIYKAADGEYVSNLGRTKTAPTPDADVPVRFALAGGQDFNGKYYNPYKRMAMEEFDFVVHLGDYVYETTADPSFQDSTPERSVMFGDKDGAILFNGGTDDEYRAASSLDNYRDLYRIYRSDLDLQKVHEWYPMIVIWDDHEYSDDCFGATATYYDGREDEYNLDRRKRANQVYFEYMPVDYPDDPDFVYDPSVSYPDDIRIYRDFEFGKNVSLVLTDLRTYRSDHLIPENAFPGKVVLDETTLMDRLGELPDSAGPYVDIEAYEGGLYVQPLLDCGYAESDVTGLISAAFVNQSVVKINEEHTDEEPIALITEEQMQEMPLGLAWLHMGKLSQYSAVGSRYFAIQKPYQLYAKLLWEDTDGAMEDMMGSVQESWFFDKMTKSTKTWKVWGNEFCLVPRLVDLSNLATLPDGFRDLFQLSAEDWDGMPNRRDLLIDTLGDTENVVVVAGDIHAFFAGVPASSTGKQLVEFVGSSISSSTYKNMLERTASSDPGLAAMGAPLLARIAEQLMTDPELKPNPTLSHINMTDNGFIIFEADSSEFKAFYYAIDGKRATENITDPEELQNAFSIINFKVESGSPDMYKEVDGSWKKWDVNAAAWV